MSLTDSYRFFPDSFHTLKVSPSLLRTLFHDILCIHRVEDSHHVLLIAEEDEDSLESMVRRKRDALSTSNISAVYYLHVSNDTKVLIAEYLFESVVFFVYVNVMFVHQTYIGVIKISQYGYRFFFNILPEDVRLSIFRLNFVPPAIQRSCFIKIKDWLKRRFP